MTMEATNPTSRGAHNRPRRKARRGGLSARQIQQVTQYVRDNLDQPIRINDLSAVAGLSVSQFSRNFKVSTGEAPHRWLLNTRLERAKSMPADYVGRWERQGRAAAVFEVEFAERWRGPGAIRGAQRLATEGPIRSWQ